MYIIIDHAMGSYLCTFFKCTLLTHKNLEVNTSMTCIISVQSYKEKYIWVHIILVWGPGPDLFSEDGRA